MPRLHSKLSVGGVDIGAGDADISVIPGGLFDAEATIHCDADLAAKVQRARDSGSAIVLEVLSGASFEVLPEEISHEGGATEIRFVASGNLISGSVDELR